VTTGYAIAFTVSFALNRQFNFRSHAPVGGQVVRYVGVVAVNFLVILLGLTTLLAALGVQYQLARIVAGVCEAVFMYCSLRWFVFRAPRTGAAADPAPGRGEQVPGGLPDGGRREA